MAARYSSELAILVGDNCCASDQDVSAKLAVAAGRFGELEEIATGQERTSDVSCVV
jgi:hypothetical protein